jgi:hypothetical protein
MSLQDGIRAVQQAFGGPTPPRFPMYVRQAKQFLKNAIEGFDERKYGFASVVDLLRAAGKEGVLRIERDRQGAVRVFPGPNLAPRVVLPQADVEDELVEDDIGNRADASMQAVEVDVDQVETVNEPPILEAETVASPSLDADETGVHAEVEASPEPHEGAASHRTGTRRRKATSARTSARSKTTARSSRARKTARSA